VSWKGGGVIVDGSVVVPWAGLVPAYFVDKVDVPWIIFHVLRSGDWTRRDGIYFFLVVTNELVIQQLTSDTKKSQHQ